jgi:hypothetical protein
MSTLNSLSFERATRGGGGGRTQVAYWDYQIDGGGLRDLLRVGDFIPPFGWLSEETDTRFRQMLLLKQASDVRSGRIPLFVCAECADYGCGVLTAAVMKDGDLMIWQSFGWERDYEDEIHLLKDHVQRRFAFACSAYWDSISQLPLSARTG